MFRGFWTPDVAALPALSFRLARFDSLGATRGTGEDALGEGAGYFVVVVARPQVFAKRGQAAIDDHSTERAASGIHGTWSMFSGSPRTRASAMKPAVPAITRSRTPPGTGPGDDGIVTPAIGWDSCREGHRGTSAVRTMFRSASQQTTRYHGAHSGSSSTTRDRPPPRSSTRCPSAGGRIPQTDHVQA